MRKGDDDLAVNSLDMEENTKMDMQKDALGHAQKAFLEDREQIFLAMHVILEVVKHACKDGLMALLKDGYARNGQPYFLDTMEEKEHIEVPLKRYLAFGMEIVSMGSGIEEAEKLLTNKYFVNAFAGTDAVIAYAYWIGLRGILRRSSYLSIFGYFMSIVPDAEEDAFEKFAAKLDVGCPELLWGLLPFESKQKK